MADEQEPVDGNIGRLINGYYIEKTIGEGAYSAIYKAFNADKNFKVAVKVALPIPEQKYGKKRIAIAESMKREIEIYKRINSPEGSGCSNILKYYSDFVFEGNIFIILEKGKCDLYDAIKRIPQPINETDKMAITLQLTNAVLFLHSRNIIHRDIKPENIIMTGGGGRASESKLCDFGLSVIYDKHNPPTDCVGSPEYFAPEVIKCSRSPTPYDFKVDLWCLGLTIYEMYVNRNYFYHSKSYEQTFNILMYNDVVVYPQGKVPPMAICRFIKDLIRYWPSDRKIVLESLDDGLKNDI